MNKIAIIGVGNPDRSDDGAGWAVIDLLRKELPKEIGLYQTKGDPAKLIDLFSAYSIIYCIDACLSKKPSSGSWRRIDALKEPLELNLQETSTHGFTITQGIALAKSLDQLPKQLIVFAIEGSQFEIGNGLSPDVAKSVESVANTLLQEIQGCMKKA